MAYQPVLELSPFAHADNIFDEIYKIKPASLYFVLDFV